MMMPMQGALLPTAARCAASGMLAVMLLSCRGARAEAIVDGAALAAPSRATTPGENRNLRLSTRREGINPNLPGANHVITIRVPEEALQQGWRCCWIEAFSRETAGVLSAQYGKAVAGNDADLVFDASGTESSLRQVAPGIFEAALMVGSARRTGNLSARLYVHLYRSGTGIDSVPDAGQSRRSAAVGQWAPAAHERHRFARNFLDEPVLTVRFMSSPAGAAQGETNVPPSQLPHYAPPRR